MTAAAAPRRSNAVLAAFSGPCLPLAAFGVALPVTLPEFYATYVGLELGVVATVFMAVRLIDIVFDPFLGWGMDKTRTRFGRYRPWMALATPMLMLAALMMFVLVQPGAPAVYLFGWLLFLYLGFSIGTLGQLGWAVQAQARRGCQAALRPVVHGPGKAAAVLRHVDGGRAVH